MDFKEFVNKLEQDLKDALSEISPGADVRQNSVEKLQGTSYTGISITPADSHVGMNLNKVGSQKVLEETCEYIRKADGEMSVKGIGKEKGCGGYINHVEETAGKKEISNIFRYTYERKENEDFKTINFNWNTNIELNEKNLEEMIEAGRGRWKIENEGFNNQKNGIYDIEHLNSYDTNAMKNHYLLTQIADIIMQLYLAWNPLRKEIKQSIKNTSSRLLESFRRLTVTDEDVLITSRYTTIYLE